MQTKYTEKQILARQLYWELDEIREKQRKLGVFKLNPPIQRGWARQWLLRADILRSSDGNRYLKILPFVQNSQVSRTTDFSGRNELKLKTISLKQKDLLDWPEFWWDKYFDYINEEYGYRTGVEYKYNKCYSIKKPYLFEIEIVPNFIEYLPIIDPQLESREKEIYNKIEKKNLWTVIDKFLFGSMGYKRDEWSLSLVKNKSLLKELEQEVRAELKDIKD